MHYLTAKIVFPGSFILAWIMWPSAHGWVQFLVLCAVALTIAGIGVIFTEVRHTRPAASGAVGTWRCRGTAHLSSPAGSVARNNGRPRTSCRGQRLKLFELALEDAIGVGDGQRDGKDLL